VDPGRAADETQKKDHGLSLVLGNQATGRWMRRSPFENAHVLANEIGDWLHNWKNAPEVVPGYRAAPKLRNVTRGESLFRTRCSACHVIGAGDGSPRVGPNLAGSLERRERKWVERWLKEPDLSELPVPRSDAEHAPGMRAALFVALGLLLAAATLVLRAR
jgi:hypothetical protein